MRHQSQSQHVSDTLSFEQMVQRFGVCIPQALWTHKVCSITYMAQKSCVCCRKPIRRCQGGCRAWVPGLHPLVGASAGVAGATVSVAQTSGVTQAATVSNCLHSCTCPFQYDKQLGMLNLACSAVPHYVSGQCLNSCPCLLHAIGHVSRSCCVGLQTVRYPLVMSVKKLSNRLNAQTSNP